MLHRHISGPAHNNAHHYIYQDQKGKILLCLLCFLLSHLFHDHRAPSGGKHGRDCRHKLDDRSRQIDGRKRIRTDQIRYKQAVYHRIKRHEYRHGNGRHGKFQNIFQRYRFFICIFVFHMFILRSSCIFFLYQVS